MVTGSTSGEIEQATERCPKCAECKICKQLKDKKGSSAQAEQQYIKNCVKFNQKEGKFYAKLPWKIDPSLLQGNRKIAEKSHVQARQKAYKNPEYPPMAKESIKDMVQRGTVLQVSKLPLGNGVDDGLQRALMKNKNPHFTVNQLVFKPNSASTRCRITMDGSRPTTKNKITINKCLMSGNPDYSLVRSLAFWRLKNYAASTDIGKFFNQICLYPQDRQHLNMIFSENFGIDDPPEWFCLLVHSFGYPSTSAIAKESVLKISETATIEELHEVAKALKLGYVDDINPSVDTEEQLRKLKEDTTEIMSRHGMDLKGWAVSGELPETSLSPKPFTMVGGWKWFSKEDKIQLRIPDIYLGKKKRGKEIDKSKILHQDPTEEELNTFYRSETVNLDHIISRVASLFDVTGQTTPLAVLGHYVARLALQDTATDTTAPVSQHTRKLFLKFLFLTSKFGKLLFLRNPGRADPDKGSVLVAFADASSTAWVVVLYLVRTTRNNEFFTQFVHSAGGLNPPDRTIPRSELNSYTRAAQMIDFLEDIMEGVATQKKLIGDSKSAMFWVLNGAKKTSIFVQNRVARVKATFQDEDLLYVPSADNVADLGTRPEEIEKKFDQMLPEGRFQTGPKFLTKGIQRAIEEGDLAEMTQIARDFHCKEMDKILDLPYDTTADIDLQTLDDNEQKNIAIDNILVIDFKAKNFLEDVERVTEFSNYLIHPLKISYSSFHLALTISFKFLHSFLTKVNTQRATEIKGNIIAKMNEELFVPTVDHIPTNKANPAQIIIRPTKLDVMALENYHPYLTQDQQSKEGFLQWVNYPGILTLTRLSRQLHNQMQLPQHQRDIHQIVKWAESLQFRARIMSTTQAAPVAVSMVISVLLKASKEYREIGKILKDLIDGQPRSSQKRAHHPILSKMDSIVSSPTSWPTRVRHTITQIFTQAEIREFTRVTEHYLNKKASKECAQFLSPKTLQKIAVFHQGLWLAKNRTLLQEASLKRGFVNPILRYNRSPLTVALVKHNHYINDQLPPNRLSSCYHTGPRQNQLKFQKFGVIHKGFPLFKQIQDSCLQCEMRMNRPFQIPMGQAANCIFKTFSLFSFVGIDIKGPMVMEDGKLIYVLVMVCLQTKFVELILLDSRLTESFLAAANVVFSLYGTPTMIVADQEGAMTKIYNNLDKINESLMVDHQLSITLIPAFLHHFAGTVESKIKKVGTILGNLDLKGTGLTETELSHTLRIISAHMNKQPYAVQFVSNTDKQLATGIEESSEILFIAPISFQNPNLENTFQPILVDQLNSVQKALLTKLELTEKIYKDEILPRLLLTIDSRRLTRQDTVKVGDIVLLHCTTARRRKFERAILARVDKIFPSRDSVNRVVQVSYFKASQCKLDGNRLTGTPTRIIRGLESLSMLNQDALNPCRVAEFFKHKCNDHSQEDNDQEIQVHETDQEQLDEDDTQHQETQDHSPNQLTIEQLNPSPLTMVWIEDQEEEQQSSTQDDSQHTNLDQEIVNSQEFQDELQHQQEIDDKGDKDFEVEIRQEVTLPQRITRSKNNIYKKNKKYDEDYV